MVSRVARSWNASRQGRSSKFHGLCTLSTPNRGEWFHNEHANVSNPRQSCPRSSKAPSSGGDLKPVVTSETFGNSPKCPSGMTFQQKKLARISGGRRVDTVDKEFRVRLSWIMASNSLILPPNAPWYRGRPPGPFPVRETVSGVDAGGFSHSHQHQCRLAIHRDPVSDVDERGWN